MLFVRELQTDERQALDQAANNPSLDWSQRARIILLSAASKTVPDISAEVRLHPINVRKWIHRFNMRGLAGLRSGKSPGRPPVFSETQRQEIADFRAAVEQFKADLPTVLQALRTMIDKQETGNADFRAAQARFLTHAQEAINPALGEADVREMLIQHILTETVRQILLD